MRQYLVVPPWIIVHRILVNSVDMVYTTQQDTVLNVIHTIRLAIWIDWCPIQVALTLCGFTLCDYLAKYKRIAQSETCINRNFTLCEFSWETKNAQSEGYLYVLESFCKYFPLIILLLSQLFTEISSDEFTNQQQNENMKIFTKLLWYFTGMMIAAKDWNVSDYQHDCYVSLEKS